MATRSAIADHAEVVQPIEGEWFRFYVQSRSQHDPHIVDLEEYDFNGWCNCDGFKFKREPLLARGARPSQSLRCWHIEQATLYFMRHLGPVLARALDKRGKPTTQQQQSTPSKNEPKKVYHLKFRQFNTAAKAATRFKVV